MPQFFFYIFAPQIKMVVVAQLVRASDCDSEGRGFEPPRLPIKRTKQYFTFVLFFYGIIHKVILSYIYLLLVISQFKFTQIRFVFTLPRQFIIINCFAQVFHKRKSYSFVFIFIIVKYFIFINVNSCT